MATVHFRNAKIIIGGSALSGSFTEFNVEYSVETLDETAFGDTTRINKAGLFNTSMTGKGWLEFGTNEVEDVLFNMVGVDNTSMVVFADGITEGTTTDKGFAMLGVLSTFNMGSAVGTILPFDFTMSGRGALP